MAWRDPIFVTNHSWRVAGDGSLVANTEAADFPKGRVIDDQRQALFKWNAAIANNVLTLDRGGGTLETVDRLLIPDTHNLNTTNLILETSTTGVFGGEETSRVNITAGAGIISESFTPTTDRHHRIRIVTVHQGEIGEIFIGQDRQTTRGPDPSWADEEVPNIVETRMRSGLLYRVQASGSRRRLQMTFPRIEGTNKTLFDDLQTQINNGLFPFWFFPPDTAELPIYVQLDSQVLGSQDSPNPRGTGQKFEKIIAMIEVLK